MKRAIFPGSFNPFTIGHQSIVDRGLAMFDEIVIALGVSFEKGEAPETRERMEAISRLYAGNPSVKVVCYNGLTVDAAKQYGCDFILRGVRNMADFEYERNMADVNLKLSGIETVILLTRPELATVSSSLVRELQNYGRDVSDMLPKQ